MSKLNTSNRSLKDNTLFVFFLVVAFFLPWPNGLELTWEFLFYAFIIFSLSLIYYVNFIKTDLLITNLLPYKTPLTLLFILVLHGVFQTITLPYELIKLLSPNRVYAQSNTFDLLSIKHNINTLSIAPEVSLIELLKNLSYFSTFILTIIVLNSKQRIITLLNTLFFSSAIIAFYSLINHYTDGSISIINSIPPWTQPWSKITHGTFSYQNHYASFLMMTIPLGCGLLHYSYKSIKDNGIKPTLSHLLVDILLSKNGFYILSIIIMVLALIETSSRGGNLIFIISIIFTFVCFVLLNYKKSLSKNKSNKSKLPKKLFIVFSIITALLFTLISTGATDKLSQRYEKQGLDPSGRDIMLVTVSKIVKKYPLFGSGAGTYPVIQHQYKPAELGNTAMSKRAHNDYLEFLCNLGIIGFILLMSALILLYIKLVLLLKNTGNNFIGINIACFSSISAICMHSLIDFNFHLPANAIYFFMILAAGLQAGQLSKLRSNRKD